MIDLDVASRAAVGSTGSAVAFPAGTMAFPVAAAASAVASTMDGRPGAGGRR